MRHLLLALTLAWSGSAAAKTKSTRSVDVTMSAATLADDCGKPAVHIQPSAGAGAGAGARARSEVEADVDVSRNKGAKAKRKCEQTSMQLAIAVPAGVTTTFKVKKVEIFDERGKSVGELTPRAPAVWSTKDNVYRAWDEKLAPGDYAVTYTLSAPNWTSVSDRFNKTFTVKAEVVVGTTVQPLTFQVAAQTSLPPNVKT